ncbi:MAG: lipopolysaccharide biosynthesis protein [Ruminococcaceae bacterium]|nr:lipopolysaccharide biosynthesis protein [Oscillospiraceae bacterium]
MENKKVLNNFFWRLLERIGAQGVTFVVSIVLARLLDPTIYGTIALVTVFTTIMQVFVDSGLGNALIQKKDADDLDFSTVFYFNIVACTVLYAIMFFCAPLIASFYERPELTPIVRVLSLTLVISGVKNIQQAYVSKNMLFKRFFYSTIGGTIGAAAVGIGMAIAGFGVWALVAQSLFNSLVGTVILWFTVKWRPKWMFSFKRLKGLFSFGWKLLVSNLINTVYNDIRQLIIGKLYTSEDLAFYNKGHQFPQLVVTNINTSIDSVLFPAMASAQDERERVKAMTRRAIKTSTYLMMPIMIGLAVCAEPFIKLLLTEKWLPCVFFMRIFCITMAFYPIHTANLNAMKAMGRSDIFLKLEIIKKGIGITVLLATMWISVEAMAYSLLFTALISQIVNAAPNKKLLGYSYLQQVKDMLPQIALSIGMGAIVYCVTFLPIHEYLMLLIQIPLGALIYILGSKLFRLESFSYVLSTAKSYLRKKSNKAKE